MWMNIPMGVGKAIGGYPSSTFSDDTYSCLLYTSNLLMLKEYEMKKITKYKIKFLLGFLFLFIPAFLSASAQNVLLNLDFTNVPLSKMLNEIGRQTSLSVVYNTKDINPDRVVTIKANREKLGTVMNLSLIHI